MAGYAWYNFAQSVRKGSLIGTTSWGIVAVEASIGVFFPDPVATAIGAVVTKSGGWLRGIGMRVFTWAYKNPAKSNLIVFIALMPSGIKERQELKAERGLIEPIGAMTFEAERIPDTERLSIPSIPTSRVF
jgi:hypothetical protein